MNLRRMLAAALLAGPVMAFTTAPSAAPVASPSPSPSSPAPPAPHTKIGIKLLQAPASERNDPRAYVYIIDHLPPGTVIHRKFQVANMGSRAARISVYPAAATIGGGQFRFAPGTTRNELTTWVRISHPALNLRPHQRATDTATITVPRDATRGEHYGVIWAQTSGGTSGNVRLVSRVGIRMYLSVGPGGAPPSDFALGTPTAGRAHGRPFLTVPVRNTGGRAVDILGLLTLASGPGGLRAGPFRAATVVTLAPGQSGRVSYLLGAGLPNGPWQAQVKLQSGFIIKTRTYTVNFIGRVSAGASTFPVALVAGLAALVVILAIAAALIISHRRRTRRPPAGTRDKVSHTR